MVIKRTIVSAFSCIVQISNEYWAVTEYNQKGIGILMQKIKRILAFVGAIVLLGMYGATLFFGLTANPASQNMLIASIACTIIVPCLLYGMILVTRVLDNRDKWKNDISKAEETDKRDTDHSDRLDQKDKKGDSL